jgi:hypothetical protein
MKKCLVKNSILSFFCILNCLGTVVFDDERKKEQTLFDDMKPNKLKEDQAVRFVPADKLGLKFRNALVDDVAFMRGTGRFNGKDITYAIYDVHTSVLQGDDKSIVETLIDLEAKEYTPNRKAKFSEKYKRSSDSIPPACYFGCGLHTMKNLIYMTRILKAKTKNERDILIDDMNSYAVFLHYIEGKNKKRNYKKWNRPWVADSPGRKNWLKIWGRGKKWFDEPPATFEDTKRLRIAILTGEAFAPKDSKEVLKNAIILGKSNVKKKSNKKLVWKNGIQSLKRRMKESASFVIPLHIYYTWYDKTFKPQKPIRHWIAVVLRGFKNNNLDIFVVDSGQYGLSLNAHKKLVGRILQGLGIKDTYKVQAPSPIRNNSNPCLTLNRPQHSKKIMQSHALKRPSQNIS